MLTIPDKIMHQLEDLGQTHLLQYFDTLSEVQQEVFLAQLEHLDYTVLQHMEVNEERGKLEPLYAETIPQIEAKRDVYTAEGLAALQAGKVGAVLLAGGQGSRLGFEKPKGMYNLGETRSLYIFQCLMENLMKTVKAAGAWVPLFVMTSVQNYDDTTSFFAAQNYFGYDPAHIWFFRQEELPVVDLSGKMRLAEKGRVCTAPNGNGGWYASMQRTGMTKILEERGIEWLNVFAVDNVLQQIADPCFIGAVLKSGMTSGAKVVAKAAPDERVGVLCLEDGHPSIVEYYEITDEMLTRREPDGTLSYNYGVILNYLFRVDHLERTLSVQMPLHRAIKAVACLNEAGVYEKPDAPNVCKFETLALDMVRMQESCLAYEVDRNKEFAPIKCATGVDSVESAKALLKQNGVVL